MLTFFWDKKRIEHFPEDKDKIHVQISESLELVLGSVKVRLSWFQLTTAVPLG